MARLGVGRDRNDGTIDTFRLVKQVQAGNDFFQTDIYQPCDWCTRFWFEFASQSRSSGLGHLRWGRLTGVDRCASFSALDVAVCCYSWDDRRRVDLAKPESEEVLVCVVSSHSSSNGRLAGERPHELHFSCG